MVLYILLGIIQGLTEFLPISSSGHLVLLQNIFGFKGEELEISIVLHLGTLLAVVIFFFGQIKQALRNIRIIGFITVVTAITAVVAVLTKDMVELLFSSAKVLVFSWLFSGLLLIYTKKVPLNTRNNINTTDSVFVGLSQAVAIIPGISRSGITIATLLLRGVDKLNAFSFSFLISIPAVLGATLLEAKEINFAFTKNPIDFFMGFLSSFVSGLFGLWLLKRILTKAGFYWFGYYCLVMGVLSGVLIYLGLLKI
ncbi:MAG: undecaprenyl-diphosphate phosphatase [Candidatus Omnitrophica bacterium]|nr:undecaprenyl-diphosphate phosphatase [Candidatus Omnitrophota bacterium]